MSLIVAYMNIIIMAGGGGSRLWPLSRQNAPKQFLDLGTGKSLLEMVYARARTLTDAKGIYIATSESYRPQIKKLLSEIDDSHVFYEPEKRDTTAAFATIALRLESLGQGEVPAVFMWSDHIFTNEEEFLEDVAKIPKLLSENPDAIVIAGHTPVSAETGLGYMEVGEKLAGYNDVFHVKAFKEKPDRATAEAYVAAGNYFWNLGYFSMRPAYLLTELLRYNPELQAPVAAFRQALVLNTSDALSAAYREFPKIAIEYTLIEKTPRRLALTGDYGWSDIGNWSTIKDIFGKHGDYVPAGHHVHVDSQDNYVYNATPCAVSLVGLKDTIVVVTPDAILVTDKNHSHKVKQVVDRLEKDGKKEYL